MENIELQNVLQEAAEVSRPLIEARKHQLTIDAPSKPIWLKGDLTRLAQIISNLLNNAAKYTQEGGHIVLSIARHGQEVDIAITDNGLGLPEDMLQKVFELFTQVDRNLERSQGGLGIGLALVETPCGDAWWNGKGGKPRPCKGSTFTVRMLFPT